MEDEEQGRRPPPCEPPAPDLTPPEVSMVWRRWITILVSICLLTMLWFIMYRLLPTDLLAFAQGVMLLLTLVWLFYFGGASAADLAGIVQAAKIRINWGPLKPSEKAEEE